jgi:LacI family transcriptional regulator
MAAKLNYQPNVAARNLKLNRNLRVAVRLPEHIASFFDPLRQGIRKAASEALGVRVELNFQTYPRLGEGDIALLQEDLKQNYDGIILTPGNPRRIDPLLRQFEARGTQVLCVATDAPRSPRLASVCVDAYVCGALAAELLAMKLAQPCSVAVMIGDLNTHDHAEKLRGFAATLAVQAPHLQLLPALESHEQPQQAYEETLSLLAREPQPAGIYVSTANSPPVLAAIEEKGLLGRIPVVTSDLFPELIPWIENGGILATLDQRPATQGRMAFDQLVLSLINGVRPNLVTRLAPHIVLRANLSLFTNQWSAENPE